MATGFFFGTGNDDADNASSKRKLAEAMLARGSQGSASNWAEGANKAAQMILGAMLTKQADAATSAADAAAFSGLFGGGAGAPTPGTTASAAPSQTQDQMRAAAGIEGTAANKDAMDPNEVRSMFIDEAKRQGLVGIVPTDGAKYGITTGSPEEWGNLFTGLAKHESGLRNSTVGDVGQFDGGSRGLLQLSYADAPNYGLNGGQPFTPEQLADPRQNAAAGVAIAKSLVDKAGSIGGGMGKYWGPISREGWTPGNGRDRGLPWGSWRSSDAGAAIDGAMGVPAGLPKGVQVASADPDYVPQSIVQAALAGQPQAAAAPMAYDVPMPRPRPQMVSAPQPQAAGQPAAAAAAPLPAGARMVDGQPMFQRQTPQGITYWTPYANADNAPDAPSRSPIDAITSLLSSRQQGGPQAAVPQPQATVQAAMAGGAQQAPQAAPQAGAAMAGNDRTAALMRIAANPNLSPQMRAIVASVLQQQIKPVEYGFQTLPDGTIIKTDPRTGQVAPVYQAAPKPVTLSEGAVLVDPTTGKTIATSAPKPMAVPEGGTLVDPSTGRVVAGGGQKPTAEQKDYEAAKAGGYTGSFSDYQVMLKKATAPTAESKFDQEMGTKQAQMFSDLLEAGQAARGDVATIKQLRQTISKTPGGTLGGWQNLVSQFGIKTLPGTSDIEAASSLISKLVPQQRQGMPGAASDRDVAMFRDALPKLGNTPEGNALILDTMQALAESRVAQGDIAAKVATGQMSRQDAIQALQALPDPFARFKAAQGGQPAGQSPAPAAAIDTSKPGAFVFNPATGKLEPAK